MRVVAAMSGGVDSSVAAALLKEQGHEVIGVTLQLWPRDAGGGCCGLDAIADARRVACKLGIPHYVMDVRKIFEDAVVADFCAEYARGRTPNPCVVCNNAVKWGALLDRARELDAEAVATGHYARLERDETGFLWLKKGVDAAKDQSYFLCRLTRGQLGHAAFPVGHLTKRQVRAAAAKLGLPVADRPESQEICFVPDDDYAAFLAARTGAAGTPGPILDKQGRALGRHKGIAAYTIGQRRGLGLAAGKPLYVTGIDAAANTVTVGGREETFSPGLVAGRLNWLLPEQPSFPLAAGIKVRSRAAAVRGMIEQAGAAAVRVTFAGPQMAVTPGQTVAFYRGDTVIGGGVIEQQGR
jgi:tRNA-specific 2-thiouridylase